MGCRLAKNTQVRERAQLTLRSTFRVFTLIIKQRLAVSSTLFQFVNVLIDLEVQQ